MLANPFAAAQAPAAEAADRERRVLTALAALIPDADEPSFFLRLPVPDRLRRFAAFPAPPETPMVLSFVTEAPIPADELRAAAEALMRAYGLAPVRDVRVAIDGGSAKLDLYDAAVGVAVEIRALAPLKAGPEFLQIAPVLDAEADEDALSERERRRLAGRRVALHVVDREDLIAVGGTAFAAKVGYARDLVAFLNDAAGGPPVDLSGLDPGPTLRLRGSLRAAGRASRPAAAVLAVVPQDALVVEATPEAGRLHASPLAAVPAGRATVRFASCVATRDGGPVSARFVQFGADGARRTAEAPRGRAFLPSDFDLALPFDVEFDLEGRAEIPTEVAVTWPRGP